MKKKLFGIRVALSMCAALGWWGLLYPQLAFTPDTVSIKAEDNDDMIRDVEAEWDFDASLYRELLAAGPDKIILRSRLLTDFSSLWEAFHHGNK